MNDQEQFVLECVVLANSIKSILSASAPSDRVAMAVISRFMKEIIDRQENPRKALDQLIFVLMDVRNVNG